MNTHTRTDPYRADADAAAGHLDAYAWVVTDTWDYGDPWGSAMAAAFTLNDVLHLAGGETNPTYRPGMGGPAIEDDHGGTELLDALESGELQVEQVERAERALDVLIDRLDADGRSY